MTRTKSSGARGRIAKIAVTGLLFGIPVVAVSIPAFAAPGGAPVVLPAPLPAEPATTAPEPPPPAPAPVQSNYTEDWWGYYNETGGGGGGGGGG